MRWQRNAIANAHSAVSENSRKIEDHRSVFVGASSSQPRSMSEHASHTSTPRSNLSTTARATSTTAMAARFTISSPLARAGLAPNQASQRASTRSHHPPATPTTATRTRYLASGPGAGLRQDGARARTRCMGSSMT